MTQPQRFNISLFLLLLVMAALSYELIQRLQAQQSMTQDRAEIQHVKYGMLNANNWVSQVSVILLKKINELEITGENRAAFKRSLERILDTLIVEADRQMRRRNRSGNWLQRQVGKVKQRIADGFVDIEAVRASVPQYAEEILRELDKPQSRAELNEFLSGMVEGLKLQTYAQMDLRHIEVIHAHYGCHDRISCEAVIDERLRAAQPGIHRLTAIVLALAGLLFYACMATRRERDKARLAILAISAALLMLCGILTPMIVAEARITELRFVLMGEPLVFRDEVFYFQSKSVLDVVGLLLDTGVIETMLVALLVVMFCLVFPLAKLFASFVYLYDWRGLRTHWATRFFALKSAKWSMADVLVVAMFMAYVGFDGLVSSQLEDMTLGAQAAGGEILTTNGTSLQIGFYLFFAFCMVNLLSSVLLEGAIEESRARQDGDERDAPVQR